MPPGPERSATLHEGIHDYVALRPEADHALIPAAGHREGPAGGTVRLGTVGALGSAALEEDRRLVTIGPGLLEPATTPCLSARCCLVTQQWLGVESDTPHHLGLISLNKGYC